jgi:hypothetical protein
MKSWGIPWQLGGENTSVYVRFFLSTRVWAANVASIMLEVVAAI